MQRFHINPKTGNPGLCRAKTKCPFGDLLTEHYNSREEAAAAYEARYRVLNFKKLKRPEAKRVEDRILATAQAALQQSGKADLLSFVTKKNSVYELELRDWTEAIEVKQRLEEQGYLAELGAAGEGQWLRVQPMPPLAEQDESKQCEWDMAAKSFVGSRRELGRIPRFMRSSRTGELAELGEAEAHYDEAGKLTHWTLEPLNPTRTWRVTVVND